MCRRCGERDRRGGARDRRARKRWLLTEFGDGTTAECFWGCGTKLTFLTVQQDRIVPGGPYRRDNLVPSCADCNIKRAAETIPDGCHYGPVGDLHTDRRGRYPDEPELAAPDRDPANHGEPTAARAATPIPQPRSGSAAPTRAGDRRGSPASDEGLTAMHFPRPHRSIHRATPPPERQRQPAAVSAVALAEHAHDDRPVVIAPDEAASIEPDLVVIDTTDLDELRTRHPWLFARDERPDAESRSDGPALHVHSALFNLPHRGDDTSKDRLASGDNAERPPWLRATNAERVADPTDMTAALSRIDADLAYADSALNAVDEAAADTNADGRFASVVDEAVEDGDDAGWGR